MEKRERLEPVPWESGEKEGLLAASTRQFQKDFKPQLKESNDWRIESAGYRRPPRGIKQPV